MSEQTGVLVIDDEKVVRIVLEHRLKADGFKVYMASDGSTGLELARNKKPVLILLDWMMPGMSGLEVLSELKTDESTKHIPVFMLTTKDREDEINRAFDRGADGYITKPFGTAQLGEILKKELQEHAKTASST